MTAKQIKQERASKYFNHFWFFGFDMQQAKKTQRL